MPRWTGPARIVARGDSPRARFRATQLIPRARTLCGQIANDVALGDVWFGTREFKIDDNARIFVTVNDSFESGYPEVRAIILVTSEPLEEQGSEVIPAGISYGVLTGNAPKFLLSLPDKALSAAAIYTEDAPLDANFTYPAERLELEDQDFSSQAPFNNISSDYRAEYGYDWEDLSGQTHLVVDYRGESAPRLASSYFDNTSTPPDPAEIWKQGYKWSLLPPVDPGVTQYFRGCGVFGDTLHVIMEERTASYGIFLRAYTRPFSPTPYATNTLDDGNDEFTWTLAASYEMAESSLPTCEALGVTNDPASARVSTAPGFFFAASGFEAVAVFKRSGYFYIEMQYIVGAGFLVMGGGWKFNYIPYFTGNQGPDGALLNGATSADFSAERGSISTNTEPPGVTACDDGDYEGTNTLTNSRAWSTVINTPSVQQSDLEAPFAELEVQNATLSMENVLGIDYQFGGNAIQRLKLDITGTSIAYNNTHTYDFTRAIFNEFYCIAGEEQQDATGTATGQFTASSVYDATGAVLKINNTEICALEEVDHNWQFYWDATHGWSCTTNVAGGAIGLVYSYTAASGSVTITGSYTQNYAGVAGFAFADLRFGQVGLHQFEATTSYTISGSGTPSIVEAQFQPGIFEVLSSFDVRLNSAGSSERDKALYYNGFQLSTVLDLPRASAGLTGKVYDAVSDEQIVVFPNSLRSGTAGSASNEFSFMPSMSQLNTLFGNGASRGYWAPFERGPNSDPPWPLYPIFWSAGEATTEAASLDNYPIPIGGLFPEGVSSPIDVGVGGINSPTGYSGQRGGNYVCNFAFTRPLLTSQSYFTVNGAELPFLGVDYDEDAAGASFGQLFSF